MTETTTANTNEVHGWIPMGAVGAGKDITEPAQGLLRGLSLLPKKGDLEKAGPQALLGGPPDSVAVIEAGATAAAKWWSVSIAGGGVLAGAAILKFWNGLGSAVVADDGKMIVAANPWNQPFALLALGLIFASAGLGISYLLGSDVRGRAAASVATIQARQAVAAAMLKEAGNAHHLVADAKVSADEASAEVKAAADAKAAEAKAAAEKALTDANAWVVTPITFTGPVTDTTVRDKSGFNVLAMRQKGDDIQFMLNDGDDTRWVPSGNVDFTPVPPTPAVTGGTTPN